MTPLSVHTMIGSAASLKPQLFVFDTYVVYCPHLFNAGYCTWRRLSRHKCCVGELPLSGAARTQELHLSYAVANPVEPATFMLHNFHSGGCCISMVKTRFLFNSNNRWLYWIYRAKQKCIVLKYALIADTDCKCYYYYCIYGISVTFNGDSSCSRLYP